jgi:hypothetical protein
MAGSKKTKKTKKKIIRARKKVESQSTSELVLGVFGAVEPGRKETNLPPKPKEAPVGHLSHFGALIRAENNAKNE